MLFIPCNKRKGSNYYEFQYCKIDKPIDKILNNYKFGAEDSLLVHGDNDKAFMEIYADYLDNPYSPDNSNTFCCYGVNYYDKEKTRIIINTLKNSQPIYYEVLISWLKNAVTLYNGFYFLGI